MYQRYGQILCHPWLFGAARSLPRGWNPNYGVTRILKWIKYICVLNLPIFFRAACSCLSVSLVTPKSLKWRHIGRDGISNHRHLDCLLKRFTQAQIKAKQTSKLCVTSLRDGKPPVIGGIPSQRGSNGENISIGWRHHDMDQTDINLTITKYDKTQTLCIFGGMHCEHGIVGMDVRFQNDSEVYNKKYPGFYIGNWNIFLLANSVVSV